VAQASYSSGLYLDVARLNIGFSGDVNLWRDAANTLALRNGTVAQSFRIYNTYTDASDYERVAFAAQSNNFDLYSEFAGAGVSTRKIRIYTTGQGNVELGTDGTIRWYVTGSQGHFLANVDNTYDIGASGANRPRSGFFGTSVVTPKAYVTTSESPASGAACTAGQITWDASYIYVCTASGAWKRAALTGGY
jgi:hypothetical protein